MRKIRLIAMCVISLIITSCADEVDLLSYVPINSGFVGNINTVKIVDKSGLKINNGEISISKYFDNPEDKQFMNELLNSGISFDQNIVVYGNADDISIAVLCEVSDCDKLAKHLIDTYKAVKNKGVLCGGDDYTLIAMNDNVLLAAYSNSKLSPEKKNELASKLLRANDKSIKTKKEAIEILNKDNDINFYIEPSRLIETFCKLSYNNLMINAIGEFCKDAIKYQSLTINVDKNQLKCISKATINNNSRIIKMINQVITKPNLELLKYLPGNSSAVITLPINGAQIVNLPEFKSLMDQSRPMLMALDPYVIAAVGSIKNAVYGMTLNGDRTLFNFVVESSNPDVILRLLLSNPMMRFVKSGNKYINNDICENDLIELTVTDKYLCFTNQANVQSSPTAFDVSAIRNIFNKSIFVAYINALTFNSIYGLNLSGEGTLKFSSLENCEFNLYLKNSKNESIIPLMIKTIFDIKRDSEKKKLEAKSPFDDSEDYFNDSGEPLHDIYE